MEGNGTAANEDGCYSLLGDDVLDFRDSHLHPEQVAGHGNLLRATTRCGHGVIIKPLRNEEGRELGFYTSLHQDVSVLTGLRPFIPTYFGHFQLSEAYDGVHEMVVMEDLAAGFSKPSVMDLKIGTRQHTDDMDADKIAGAVAKCKASTSFTTGIRVCGMKVWKYAGRAGADGSYVVHNKAYGKALTAETFSGAVRDFFDDGKQVRMDVVKSVEETLKRLQPAMEVQKEFQFYSSSLLIIYDAAADEKETKVVMKMVDFAHAIPTPGCATEDGYMLGLRTFGETLSGIVAGR